MENTHATHNSSRIKQQQQQKQFKKTMIVASRYGMRRRRRSQNVSATESESVWCFRCNGHTHGGNYYLMLAWGGAVVLSFEVLQHKSKMKGLHFLYDRKKGNRGFGLPVYPITFN